MRAEPAAEKAETARLRQLVHTLGGAAVTRAENVLYRARHVLWAIAIVLFLGGAAAVGWLLVDRGRLAGQLAHEADLRGEAVSTLAGDVRVLREQLKAEEKTSAAPDPPRAIEDLPARAEVTGAGPRAAGRARAER
ncbi:hypothetical protein ABZ322_20985 [Streptomyces sp. NPDC006129]|uniref:hypothetical protein n=1 Tax=unclassified Streptomyces TaxID=2593676 RepID=UPI0033A87AA6